MYEYFEFLINDENIENDKYLNLSTSGELLLSNLQYLSQLVNEDSIKKFCDEYKIQKGNIKNSNINSRSLILSIAESYYYCFGKMPTSTEGGDFMEYLAFLSESNKIKLESNVKESIKQLKSKIKE